MSPPRRRQYGFSLLELLVAFTILALSLGVLMQIFSGSLRNVETTTDQAQATLLAQTLLASVGVEERLTEGESAGQVGDRFRWTLRVLPFVEAPAADQPAAQPQALALELWQVRARVAWGNPDQERSVVLDTLRSQTAAQP